MIIIALAHTFAVVQALVFVVRSDLRQQTCPECEHQLGWRCVRWILLEELSTPSGPGLSAPITLEPYTCPGCKIPISVWPTVRVAEWAIQLPPIQHPTFGELRYDNLQWNTHTPIELVDGVQVSVTLFAARCAPDPECEQLFEKLREDLSNVWQQIQELAPEAGLPDRPVIDSLDIQPFSEFPIKLYLANEYRMSDWLRLSKDWKCERIPVHAGLFERLMEDDPSQKPEHAAKQVSEFMGMPIDELFDSQYVAKSGKVD